MYFLISCEDEILRFFDAQTLRCIVLKMKLHNIHLKVDSFKKELLMSSKTVCDNENIKFIVKKTLEHMK